MNLFGDEDVSFSINKDYADRYENWRGKEELQKLKDKYGDDAEYSSSSSESEDDDAEGLTPQLEKDWLRTLAALKSKNPKIYDKDFKFYKPEKSSSGDQSSEDDDDVQVSKRKKDKPMFIKDYDRKVILEKGGIISESDDEEEEEKPPGYYEEQELIKQSFKTVIDDDESEDELLTQRDKSKEELAEEESDYLQWLKGQTDELEIGDKVGVELNPLKDYWNNPLLPSGEKFLRDYILNKAYKHDDDNEIPTYDEIVNGEEQPHFVDDIDASEDERELEREEAFEHKYNFRFEDPDPEFIKSYPRTIENSIRRKDTHRTDKRQETKERKKEEKDRKMDELRQLRNLKKKEVKLKIQRIKQAGDANFGLAEEDLEEDFDPEKHDKMMQEMFSSDYYGEEEGFVKPTWKEDELEEEDWDQWTGERKDGRDNAQEDTEEQVDDKKVDDKHDYQHFNMDAEYDSGAMAKSKKKWNRKSKFAQALHKKKPVYDPDEATFEEYFNEFYKLDYEDIVADQPCRFKYRQVIANSFGLSTDEVLKANEKELNQWVSVKKMVQYRTTEEERYEQRKYQFKAKNVAKKLQVLQSLTEREDEPESKDDGDKKGKKRRKRKRRRESSVTEQTSTIDSKKEDGTAMDSKKEEVLHESPQKLPKRKRRRMNSQNTANKESLKSDIDTKQTDDTAVAKQALESSPVKQVQKKNTDQESSEATSQNQTKAKPSTKAPESKTSVCAAENVVKNQTASMQKGKKKRNRKKKGQEGSSGQNGVDSSAKSNQNAGYRVSDERLKAYGLNPAKIKYTHPHLKTYDNPKKK